MRHAFLAPSAMALGVSASLLFAMPAVGQTVPLDTRVDRIEKELRAVQRKVFPAGTPVEPEITRPATTTPPPGSPSSAPIADLTARVGALESQLASITGQVEENSYKLKQLEDAFNKYKAEQGSAVVSSTPPAVRPTASAPSTGAAPSPRTAAPAEANDARKTAVAAIERPDTGDSAGDAYTYGFRLWDAKFYPEAQTQLKATVEKYGDSSVGSRAQNLLGRAYLDDGKPALASVAFYENYQKRPRGERAPDSLTYLGEALIQLKKPADACKVYAELEQVYGASLSAGLRGMMEKGRVRAKCS
ncbi:MULTISPECIES: hypothetical protein [Sphingobium]|uniref:YbgF trimerisation domain-containing protein n=2 Tax=Sphingobium TaxID=165695 RepID=T0GRB5_9SPHN|nr:MULTISPECIES: hypothetical protein [Sphingobium]EQB03212.1 hypothetical protein L485_06705 [Sphingobium baderi LL03]KMS62547.1 hypothetical protein V475_07395 [Sphingobium baderi LL03]TWH94420.1 TolA-binding protein [Sphingobium wenxiniae]WRD76693.1 hypothetical protein QQ987_00655 [Sphingobium baderi]